MARVQEKKEDVSRVRDWGVFEPFACLQDDGDVEMGGSAKSAAIAEATKVRYGDPVTCELTCGGGGPHACSQPYDAVKDDLAVVRKNITAIEKLKDEESATVNEAARKGACLGGSHAHARAETDPLTPLCCRQRL